MTNYEALGSAYLEADRLERLMNGIKENEDLIKSAGFEVDNTKISKDIRLWSFSGKGSDIKDYIDIKFKKNMLDCSTYLEAFKEIKANEKLSIGLQYRLMGNLSIDKAMQGLSVDVATDEINEYMSNALFLRKNIFAYMKALENEPLLDLYTDKPVYTGNSKLIEKVFFSNGNIKSDLKKHIQKYLSNINDLFYKDRQSSIEKYSYTSSYNDKISLTFCPNGDKIKVSLIAIKTYGRSSSKCTSKIVFDYSFDNNGSPLSNSLRLDAFLRLLVITNIYETLNSLL